MNILHKRYKILFTDTKRHQNCQYIQLNVWNNLN
jgi:hypothetical protein